MRTLSLKVIMSITAAFLAAVPSLVRAKKVLIIGDSHSVGPPGNALRKKLEARGFEVKVLGRIGRSSTFLVKNEPQVWEAAVGENPNIVIFLLGTNDNPSLALEQAYTTMKGVFPDAWLVGPPSYLPKAMDGTKDLNKAAVGIVERGKRVFGGRYVDSRPLTKGVLHVADGREPDKIHFKPKGGEVWATGIVQELDRRSSMWFTFLRLVGLA